MKYVLLLAVAAIGIAWFHGRHEAVAAEQNLFGAIASELAKRPVTVRCEGFAAATVDVSAEAGTVEFDAQGRPSSHTNLKHDVCSALARFSGDLKRPDFACVQQDATCSGRVFADVQAVHVLAHASAHLAGVEDEALAECQALRMTAYVAMRLGATPVQAAAVAQYVYVHLYPNLPDGYRTAGCRP